MEEKKAGIGFWSGEEVVGGGGPGEIDFEDLDF